MVLLVTKKVNNSYFILHHILLNYQYDSNVFSAVAQICLMFILKKKILDKKANFRIMYLQVKGNCPQMIFL